MKIVIDILTDLINALPGNSSVNTQYGEEYFSFVNGQHTTQGGTHQSAFREAFARTVKEFYKKDYDTQDIRTSLVAAISIKVVEPVFESHKNKTWLYLYGERR